MKLIPAIDVLDGKVVRLHQGNYADSIEYSNSPLEQLKVYEQAGAKLVHVVDLDAAKAGEFVNRTVFQELIMNSQVDLQVAGGIRDASGVEERLTTGIKRLVVGSKVVSDTKEFVHWLSVFGVDKLVAAIDVKLIDNQFIPQIKGWTESSDVPLFELLDYLTANGLQHLLCTDISRDGMMQGPNFELYADIQSRYPTLVLQASGGVSSMQDLERLEKMDMPEVISGKALLDGRIDIAEAVSRFIS